MKSFAPIATGAAGDTSMYLDTGILVKLLTPEPETLYFERELQGNLLVSSELVLVEVRSALFGKERAGLITASQRAKAETKFNAMVADGILKTLHLNSRVLGKAAQVIQACHPKIPLRALDALHVATSDHEQEFPLCTTDARMHAAAQALHIPVFPEKLPVRL